MSYSLKPHLFLSIVTAFLGLCFFAVADSQSLPITLIEDAPCGAFGITTDAVNNIYLAGDDTGERISLGKYTPEGVSVYLKLKSGPYASARAFSVVTDSKLNVYVGGWFGCGAFLMKLDANGTELYVKEFGTELNLILTSLAIDNDENVFAGGYCKDTYPLQAFIHKYTSGGDLIFERSFDRASVPLFFSWKLNDIVLDSEGSVYVTAQDASLTKFSNTGTLQFSQTISVDNTNIYGRGLARDSQDNVYVISCDWDNQNSILIKISKDGTILFNKPESGIVLAVAVDKHDNVYTTYSKSNILMILGYSPQGEQILSTVLDKPYSVCSLHVDAANNLLLAGWNYGGTYGGTFLMTFRLLNSSVPAPTYLPTTIPTFKPTAEPSAAPSSPPNTTCVSLEMVRKAEALLSQANRLVEEAKALLSTLSIPSTLSPTYTPTRSPSQLPSWMPTSKPSSRPTSVPSAVPTAQPTTPCVSVETVRRAKAMLQEADRLFDEAYTLLAVASGNNDV
eukprot:gene10811-12016_t